VAAAVYNNNIDCNAQDDFCHAATSSYWHQMLYEFDSDESVRTLNASPFFPSAVTVDEERTKSSECYLLVGVSPQKFFAPVPLIRLSCGTGW